MGRLESFISGNFARFLDGNEPKNCQETIQALMGNFEDINSNLRTNLNLQVDECFLVLVVFPPI